jgi:hypothetical protein
MSRKPKLLFYVEAGCARTERKRDPERPLWADFVPHSARLSRTYVNQRAARAHLKWLREHGFPATLHMTTGEWQELDA